MSQPPSSENSSHKAGYIAIIGRPNVGKSTLLNYILGEKLAITSRKPQTTRQNFLGIHSTENAQCIFIDTPGLHIQASKKINQFMNKLARLASEKVDIIIHISDATRWTPDDDYALDLVKSMNKPTIAVTNKMDLIKEKNAIILNIEDLAKRYNYQEIIPISAIKNTNIDRLLDTLTNYLPYGEKVFPSDQITTASIRFISAEIVREKLFKVLQQEIPYSLTVITDSFKETEEKAEIFVTIMIEKASQKPIIIGEKGKIIKMIGIQARKELETILDKKVDLRTWVKVKANWSDSTKALQDLGFTQDF